MDGRHLAERYLRRGGPELGSFCYFRLMCFLWGGAGKLGVLVRFNKLRLLFLLKFHELGAKSDRTFMCTFKGATSQY